MRRKEPHHSFGAVILLCLRQTDGAPELWLRVRVFAVRLATKTYDDSTLFDTSLCNAQLLFSYG